MSWNGWYAIKPNQTKPNQTKRISQTIFLSIRTYQPFLPAGLPNNIQCPHRAHVNKFLLVSQRWHVHA